MSDYEVTLVNDNSTSGVSCILAVSNAEEDLTNLFLQCMLSDYAVSALLLMHSY
jgi:hypothetical protein